jgi:hypothetical protein
MCESVERVIAYRVGQQFDMKLAVAASNRTWMNQTNSQFANRCLPMRIAGQAGWFILNDRLVRAKWSGGTSPKDVLIENTGSAPYAAISHFGEGILTFSIPFLFRTAPGVSMLFRGPANMPKDGIAALEGLVETDWAVASASVNWKFTRPNIWVEFDRDEPICMIVPQQLDSLERVRPCIRDIGENDELNRSHECWRQNCRDFNERLRTREPEAVKLGWQRFYFRGGAPHSGSDQIPEAGAHRNRLRLMEFGESDGSPKVMRIAKPLASGDKRELLTEPQEMPGVTDEGEAQGPSARAPRVRECSQAQNKVPRVGLPRSGESSAEDSVTLTMTWTPERQWIRAEDREFIHDGPICTHPSHDLAHLMIAANGNLLWAPDGDKPAIKIAEYNAVFLEHLLNNTYNCIMQGQDDTQVAFERARQHARRFVENHFAPFPLSAEEAYSQFSYYIDPDRIANLSNYFFEQKKAERADVDFMRKSWHVAVVGNTSPVQQEQNGIVFQALVRGIITRLKPYAAQGSSSGFRVHSTLVDNEPQLQA